MHMAPEPEINRGKNKMTSIGLLILLFVVVTSGAIIPRSAENNQPQHQPLEEEGLVGQLKPEENKFEVEPLAISKDKQNEAEEDSKESIYVANGKAPVAQILPFFGEEVEQRQKLNLLNGIEQHQEDESGGGIVVDDGYLGFGQ